MACSTFPAFLSRLSPADLALLRFHLSQPSVSPPSPSDVFLKAVALFGEEKITMALSQSWNYSVAIIALIAHQRKIALCSAAIATSSQRAFLYGGKGANFSLRSSLYIIDLQDKEITRRKLRGGPGARAGHSLSFYQQSVYMFGGEAEGPRLSNEVWSYSTQLNQWDCVRTEGESPRARCNHVAGIVGDLMVTFGGRTELGLESDCFLLNLYTREWSRATIDGWNPGPRESCAFTTLQNCIFAFGGNTSSEFLLSNSFFSLRLQAPSRLFCEELLSVTSTPSPRLGATLTVISDQCFGLFAGAGVEGLHRDFWVYFCEYQSWMSISLSVAVCGRTNHCAAAYNGAILIFGGMDEHSVPFSDCLLISPLPVAVQAAVADPPPPSRGPKAKCDHCGHLGIDCSSASPYGLLFPALNNFSRLVLPPAALCESYEQMKEPYVALLAVAGCLNAQEVAVSSLGGGLIELRTETALDPREAVGKLRARLQSSSEDNRSGAVVVSKSREFTFLLAEHATRSWIMLFDSAGQCLYPKAEIYMETLRNLMKIWPMRWRRPEDLPTGTAVTLFGTQFERTAGEIFIREMPFSLNCLFEVAFHHAPAATRFRVNGTAIFPQFVSALGPAICTERTAKFLKCVYGKLGYSRVYHRNRLVHISKQRGETIVFTLSPQFSPSSCEIQSEIRSLLVA